ncbi:low temperature requirement protein A [Solwaraspora sp. WMMD791]|uniref:low temperature requirement protein A n=1 Tax=Solwaraspora sp. WMMD791 TaxID=3016086 RepID=UPI00249B29E4|nr:low temperature requirement protein A [Solwaraspora sp. WMMD791]WFE27349.1 low temperature requirement protein A [Solwaraspora sp. WMMD791]
MHDESPHPHPTAGGLRLVRRDARVTGDVSWMELFVDVLFVFAFLKITSLMAADTAVLGTIRGILVVLLLWHCWTACVWLGNVVHVDRGGVPPMMAGIAAVLLIVGVAVPETFVDRPGSLAGPLVVVLGYLAVRTSVLAILTRSRWHEGPPGRRPAAIAWATLATSAPVLLAAALLPRWLIDLLPAAIDPELARIGLFTIALAIDFMILAAVGRGTWQMVSPWHLAERHALVVLVALGETIISIGTGGGPGTAIPVTWSLIAAAGLGMLIVTLLWWSYFDLAKILAEHALARLAVVDQTRMARDAYSGMHLPMIAGLIVLALGLKQAVAATSGASGTAWGPAHVLIVYGGVLIYLAALVGFEWQTGRLLGRSPLLGIGLLLCLLPLATRLSVLGALALLAAGLIAMILADRTVFHGRHSQLHRTVESEASRLHGVVPRELFLDLVFVFAFLQVTVLMTRQTSGWGIVRGLTLLAMLWWAWTSYSWLTNAVRTETTMVRLSTVGMATAVLLIGIAAPQAFDPAAGGLPGLLIIVFCYLAGQVMQAILLWQASRTDPTLRDLGRQAAVPSSVALLLLAGYAVVELATPDPIAGTPAVTVLWVAAITVQFVGNYPTGVHTWRPRSTRHWVDRYALITLIAFGQAVISVGLAVGERSISGGVILVAGIAAVILVLLWWSYFPTIDSARLALEARTGVDRAKLARDGFTYLHLPMIAGIIMVAYGLHQIVGDHDDAAIRYGHYAIYWGAAFYLLVNQVYWWRLWGVVSWYRVVSAAVVVPLAVPTAWLSPFWALTALTAFGLASATIEFIRMGDLRTRQPGFVG